MHIYNLNAATVLVPVFKIFSLCCRLPGFVTLGGAAGRPGSPQILKSRANTAERRGVRLHPERPGYGPAVGSGLWSQVLLGSIGGGLKQQLWVERSAKMF